MTVEGAARVLGDHPFFRGLPPRYLAVIAGCASNVAFEPGTFIFREGEAADCFYVIQGGRVALETFAPGAGALALETVDGGEVLGWSWLFPPYKWSCDARAVTSLRALALDGAHLRRECQEDPGLGYELMKRLAQVILQRLEATRIQLLDLYVNHP